MHRQILISFLLFLNLFILPLTINARIMNERVGITVKEEQLMPEMAIITRKKRLSKLIKGALIGAGVGLAGAAAYKAYKNYKANQQQQATETGRK